jgi:hypothetical protein
MHYHDSPCGYGATVAVHRHMQERNLTFPDIAMIAGTRVALGAGIGLLLSIRLRKSQREAAGWALFAVGAFTTIPLLMKAFGSHPVSEEPVGTTVEANVPL